MVTGLAVGAAAAGPVGAVVGLAAGAMLGIATIGSRSPPRHSAQIWTRARPSARAWRTTWPNWIPRSPAQCARERARADAGSRPMRSGLDVSFRTDDDAIRRNRRWRRSCSSVRWPRSMPDSLVRIAGLRRSAWLGRLQRRVVNAARPGRGGRADQRRRAGGPNHHRGPRQAASRRASRATWMPMRSIGVPPYGWSRPPPQQVAQS